MAASPFGTFLAEHGKCFPKRPRRSAFTERRRSAVSCQTQRLGWDGKLADGLFGLMRRCQKNKALASRTYAARFAEAVLKRKSPSALAGALPVRGTRQLTSWSIATDSPESLRKPCHSDANKLKEENGPRRTLAQPQTIILLGLSTIAIAPTAPAPHRAPVQRRPSRRPAPLPPWFRIAPASACYRPPSVPARRCARP
jgi:hypothetical protein